ncbi:MAG: InlB B-repeat-containing protein, partial [Bacillota bacterium]|nr:InlB B-repeat-containing protein [Bacillota bacterium]
MKKLLFIMALLSFALVGCDRPATTTAELRYVVVFDSDGGNTVPSQTILHGQTVVRPLNPTKDGFTFEYWYISDPLTEYLFSTPVTGSLFLNARWTEIIPSELTDAELIEADIANLVDTIIVSEYELYLPSKGKVNRSTIRWTTDSEYISTTGFILPVPAGDPVTTGVIVGEFTLNSTKVSHSFTVPLYSEADVELTDTRVVPFTNVTTEYEVPDGDVTLYFEDGGYVPYIKLLDFFDLLEGFIDPGVEFTITKTDTTLEMMYQYYDADFDETYDLILTVDATENTISTNDPGFYWAYVYSTETNYGRHIDYVADHPEDYYEEGEYVVYDLDAYFMDITMVDGDVVLPYYIVNQIFAGSSYYNVYYNYDGLFGIYALPEAGSSEYRAIKVSSMNNEDIPADLLVHTFNMLAFDLDYFYGLKDIMGIDSYYDILLAQKNKLLNDDPEDFDYALRDLLLKTIDEPHTSYGYPSYFNKSAWEGPELDQLTYYGSRFQTWYYDGYNDVNNVIETKWGANPDGGWNAYGPDRPHFWFLDDVTVSILLDDFNTTDMEESAVYDALLANQQLKATDIAALLPEIAGGTKFFYYNSSSETNDQLEVLVKGLDGSYLGTYHDALVALGYQYVLEATEDETKGAGYFVKTVDEGGTSVTYMVQIAFDVDFNLFYVGIIDKAPISFAGTWPFVTDVFASVQADSAVYLEMLFDQILAIQPDLENVLLDLSWNTGGNIGALYRIVGFITDQPFAVSGIDGDTGGVSTYHVQIDGVPCYSTLNWGLLITPLTFSAANQMATIFMENDLGPIIGVRSGGGACSITPILLPNGTAFTMSSNNINA